MIERRHFGVGVCTCAVCLGLGVELGQAFSDRPPNCEKHKQAGICREQQREAMLPDHAPHSDVGTSSLNRAPLVTTLSSGTNFMFQRGSPAS
jgi:hypothetical protein